MANMINALNESMRTLKDLYKGYTRDQLENKKREAEERIKGRYINHSIDDSLVSNNLDENKIAVCNNLLNTRELRDFTNFSMDINNITITYISNTEYKAIDNNKGKNIIVDGYKLTGKGAKKYKYDIEEAINEFESYIRKNRYIN